MRSYPSIYNLGHKAVTDIFLDPVVVQEKIDGSQFSFGRFQGEYKARSRRVDLDMSNPDKGFAAAIEYTQQLVGLVDGWIYRGEVLAKPKHNALTYGRVPLGNVILFDIEIGEANFLDLLELRQDAYNPCFECVPNLFSGIISNYTELKDLLSRESCLGGPIEGIAIKNYHRFGVDKHPLFAKWVREEYKEAHKREWKPGKNPIEAIHETLRTERRWEKAVERLRDDGRLQDAPQDIGPLIVEVREDILKEETQWIKDKLFDSYWKDISKGLVRGLPEWYKERLARSQFGNEN